MSPSNPASRPLRPLSGRLGVLTPTERHHVYSMRGASAAAYPKQHDEMSEIPRPAKRKSTSSWLMTNKPSY